MLSTSIGIGMCLLGLTGGITIAWLPSLVLSIFGVGTPFLILAGMLGASAGCICYVKVCKEFNYWPMYIPPPNIAQQAYSWIRPKSENSLYQDVKKMGKEIEQEWSDAYSQGWKNFSIELSNESGPLWGTKPHAFSSFKNDVSKMIKPSLDEQLLMKKHKRK